MGPETQQEQEQQPVQQKKEVIVVVQGGWVSEVTHPADTHVIVRDYDWSGDEAPEKIKVDEDGEKYVEEVWG